MMYQANYLVYALTAIWSLVSKKLGKNGFTTYFYVNIKIKGQ